MPKQATEIVNREDWLTRFAALALPLIKERTGLEQGERIIKLSCGFPSGGGKRRKNGGFTTGECHHTHGTNRKHYQIFIHPARTDPVEEVGETVIHELLHALLPGGVGHRRPFSQAAKKVGLEGKPTSTELGDELRERVKEIVEILGPYQHERLEAPSKVQSTRLLKCECPICGYLARVTLKWLDEAGAPICPQCGVSFVEGGIDEGAAQPLVAAEQTVIYQVKRIPQPTDKLLPRVMLTKFDPRWFVHMHRKGQEVRWHVLDWGPSITPDGKAVLGEVNPIYTLAESREDAIGLLEALRDGTMTYADIEPRQINEGEEEDWGELGEWDDDDKYLSDEEDEFEDSPPDDSDPRFKHEIEAGKSIDDILTEDRRRA